MGFQCNMVGLLGSSECFEIAFGVVYLRFSYIQNGHACLLPLEGDQWVHVFLV